MAQESVPRQRGSWFSGRKNKSMSQQAASSNTSMADEKSEPPPEKWSMGILNDRETEEVPGTVLLLSSNRNEPLGLQHQPERTSGSSFPDPYVASRRTSVQAAAALMKRTPDGQLLLDPQPDDSLNDPLNWPAWRRDCALLSLGFYCMIGGGMTPILAAGFNDVAKTFDVAYSRVALTTGLYMMGLGVGSVIASPTAILFGKRPVYLVSSILFVLTSVWCARAPTFAQLATARVFQGMSVSPVECLPSATIAEIFFLHERAFRVGIYTLLLLGGKNLIPLVSAAIIEAKEWRWVFWIVAMVVGFCAILLFFFVPETFWDRTPRPKSRRPTAHRSISGISSILHHRLERTKSNASAVEDMPPVEKIMTPRQQHLHEMNVHARFEEGLENMGEKGPEQVDGPYGRRPKFLQIPPTANSPATISSPENDPIVPQLHSLNSPYYTNLESGDGYVNHHTPPGELEIAASTGNLPATHDGLRSPIYADPVTGHDEELAQTRSPSTAQVGTPLPKVMRYTTHLRQAPAKSYSETLRPWNGRLVQTSWFRVALRPFVLYAYPSILWSAMVYSLSVGWLIVLSESVSSIFRNKKSYNFSALGTGLVYLSPFIGGVLGTVVAGKVSDILVRYLSRRNGGVYEPEFRLIMAGPVMITTAIGLMGYGWSAQERDKWIVPTIFFGIISFGCSLGSTTAITFCVDSYRHLAGEALVTLNFSKNIFHGLVFSLFFASWLEDDGPRKVFLAIGGIQVACLLFTIPMYIYGKRARMWTVRQKFLDRLA